jgi:hypothetical protein
MALKFTDELLAQSLHKLRVPQPVSYTYHAAPFRRVNTVISYIHHRTSGLFSELVSPYA